MALFKKKTIHRAFQSQLSTLQKSGGAIFIKYWKTRQKSYKGGRIFACTRYNFPSVTPIVLMEHPVNF